MGNSMTYKKNAKIVIVDDEINICEMLSDYLTMDGFEVKYYTDPTKFADEMKFYNQDNLDLLVLDLMMPKMDGFQLMEMLNSREETRHIPRIVVSAFPSDDNVKEVFKYGAIQFIEKPISLQKFSYQVKTLLRVKLYEDNNRCIIDLLKEKNKKLMDEVIEKDKVISANSPDNIGKIHSNLDVISHMININYNLLKNYVTIKGRDEKFKESGDYDILLDMLVSFKALFDKRQEIEVISDFLLKAAGINGTSSEG